MRDFLRILRYEPAAAVVLCLLAGLFVLCGVEAVHTTRANNACLAAGYADSDEAGLWTIYCKKRVGGTDVVVPLTQVQQR